VSWVFAYILADNTLYFDSFSTDSWLADTLCVTRCGGLLVSAGELMIVETMEGRVATCCICGTAGLEEISAFSLLSRVTSDCKPFPAGGRLAICSSCGGLQKFADARWLEEIGRIYADYDMYHQSTESDQVVMDPATGTLRPRCVVLTSRLVDLPGFPASGHWLDIGAGRGAMLRAVSDLGRGWQLHACDLDDRYGESLNRIPGFMGLYCGSVDAAIKTFDVVSMIHSLEHFVEPLDVLAATRRRLNAGGWLFVQVNDTGMNPFDLVVADHLTHFTPGTLANMVARAGYRVINLATDWVTKEISLAACADEVVESARPTMDSRTIVRAPYHEIDWLRRVAQAARDAAAAGPIGMFGSAIAGTWLAGSLGERVGFFVDEDTARLEQRHLGKPILPPDRVPPGNTVFIGLTPATAMRIYERLRGLPVRFCLPPPLEPANGVA
jgi:SAM-dependent methyltransferase